MDPANADGGRAAGRRLSDARASGRLSPLELLHPRGRAGTVLVLGTGLPEALEPKQADVAGPADLVVVAPGREERSRRAFAALAARARDSLAPDGFAYLIAPGIAQLALVGASRACGLATGPGFLHAPDAASSRYLVAAAHEPMAYAVDSLLAAGSWRGRAARPLVRIPGGAKALAAARFSGVVARRPRARPLLAWLAEAAGSDIDPGAVVVSQTWRETGGSFVVFVVDGRRPRLVAKLGEPPAAARPGLGETAALAELGDAARAAGADVPRVIAAGEADGVPLVVETGVAGRAAAVLLADRPELAPDILYGVAGWLERFGRATATSDATHRDELGRAAVAAADAVAPGSGYGEWLEEKRAAASAQALCAAHGDLTMVNVLVGRDGGFGVVDWDTATTGALPLTDFFHAAVDAYAAAGRYEDRPGAFRRCFAPGEPAAATVAELEARLARALDVDAATRDLSFHACWLEHAANERARGPEGEFAAIVRELARDPARFSRG